MYNLMKKTAKFGWFSFDLRLPEYQPTTLLQKKNSTKQNKNPTQKKPKHKICMKDLIQKNLSVTLDSE